jgi:hypothetical protein
MHGADGPEAMPEVTSEVIREVLPEVIPEAIPEAVPKVAGEQLLTVVGSAKWRNCRSAPSVAEVLTEGQLDGTGDSGQAPRGRTSSSAVNGRMKQVVANRRLIRMNARATQVSRAEGRRMPLRQRVSMSSTSADGRGEEARADGPEDVPETSG